MTLLSYLLALIPTAFAQDPCAHVPGGCDAQNVLVEQAIPAAGEFMLRIAGAGGVLMIVWAGYLMLFSGGDEAKFSKGKMAILYAVIGLLITVASQSIVQIVITEPAIQALQEAPDELSFFARAVDILVMLFDIFFLIIILYSGISIVMGFGKEEAYTKGRNMVTWAVMGAIVVNLARIIVDAAIGLFT